MKDIHVTSTSEDTIRTVPTNIKLERYFEQDLNLQNHINKLNIVYGNLLKDI